MAGWSNPTLLLHSSLYPLLKYWLQDLLFRRFYWGQQPSPSFNCKKKSSSIRILCSMSQIPFVTVWHIETMLQLTMIPAPLLLALLLQPDLFTKQGNSKHVKWQLCPSCITINRIHIWQFWQFFFKRNKLEQKLHPGIHISQPVILGSV